MNTYDRTEYQHSGDPQIMVRREDTRQVVMTVIDIFTALAFSPLVFYVGLCATWYLLDVGHDTPIRMFFAFGAWILLSPAYVLGVFFLISKSRIARVVVYVGLLFLVSLVVGCFTGTTQRAFNSVRGINTREGLVLRKVDPPLTDVSGTWSGTWTDHDRGISENIALVLKQTEGKIEGNIFVEGKKKFDIIDGTVSGNKLHILYFLSFPQWDRTGATLLGDISGDQITGRWYAHGTTWDGPWEVNKTRTTATPISSGTSTADPVSK